MLKLVPGSFYSKYPRVDHTPGDIWTGLSCYGSLSTRSIRGVVLTPACDLSNCKVESLTYIPIISIGEYFSTTAVLPLVYKRILGLAQTACPVLSCWRDHRYELPLPHELELLASEVERLKDGPASEGLKAGLKVLLAIADQALVSIPAATLASLFGANRAKDVLERIVKNNYSTDLHFLPADGLPLSYAAVPENSVALFRYPLTVPLHILDAANETPSSVWSAHVANLTQRFPAAQAFSEGRPVKLATLEPRFFADLLTRYVSLMIRLGAPSFESDDVAAMVSSIP